MLGQKVDPNGDHEAFVESGSGGCSTTAVDERRFGDAVCGRALVARDDATESPHEDREAEGERDNHEDRR